VVTVWLAARRDSADRGLGEAFQFPACDDTIYEISWQGDPNARDNPNLSRLLPEDTKK
jgi:hypothetical protein